MTNIVISDPNEKIFFNKYNKVANFEIEYRYPALDNLGNCLDKLLKIAIIKNQFDLCYLTGVISADEDELDENNQPTTVNSAYNFSYKSEDKKIIFFFVFSSYQTLLTVLGYDEFLNKDSFKEILTVINEKMHKFTLADEKNKIYFICQSSDGLYTQKQSIENIYNPVNFVDDNYNDDFKVASDKIIHDLTFKKHGIVLLHGDFGTGKTMYARYLMNGDLKKKILYIPPNMSAVISNPDFLSFIMNYKNSILLIEDAENILKTREAGENNAVSNILNLCDGILGDSLQLQIIATFNADISTIDSAILREGRLISEYKFGKLSVEKANKLITKLYGDTQPATSVTMTVAEIYNIKNKAVKTKVVEKPKFGFNS